MNRQQRRRAARLTTKTMSVDEFSALPSGCAWQGCSNCTHDPDTAGWSKMLLYRGKTALDFMEVEPELMDRDCVLCPDHARELDFVLLKNIGGQLRLVQGNA